MLYRHSWGWWLAFVACRQKARISKREVRENVWFLSPSHHPSPASSQCISSLKESLFNNYKNGQKKKGAVSVTNWSLQTSITQMALRPPGLNSKLSLQAPSYINHSDAPYSAGPRDLNCDTSHMASMSISSLYDSIAVLSPQASN